jgi:hypothetical protein
MAEFVSTSKVLSPGVSYTGQICSRQGDGTYRVTVDDPKVNLAGVRLALPVLGGHLGLQVRCNLTPLTKVKFVYGTPSFIFATIPAHSADVENGHGRSLLWGPNMDGETGVTDNMFSDHPEDMLEGEVEFSNLYGVSLQFLTTLMRMTAGDRAAVECHLINDMVRVVSGQWRHISGLGEDLIFDHGRPTLERGWSSYRHEVLGALAEKDAYAELNGDEADREALQAKRVTALGRHRFREFIGFAGDFIHSFVTDPPATMVSLAEGANASSDSAASVAGKSWIHRNSDGSVIVQSVADIRLERVVRIPVAVRYTHHEDPEITSARVYDKLEADFLKLPQAISPVDPLDVFQMAYHIRSYSRWLSRYHSFARMLQLSGEYSVPRESDSPLPDWCNGEVERRAAGNGRITYYDAYACVAIMRDGSIVLHDGYGSSVMMSNGNVQISAARHIDVEAAGDIRLLAGGSILMKARRNIELSATLGGLVLHSYAWLKMLCEKGTLWLRSNAVTDKSAAAAEPKVPGAPTPEVAGWEEGESDGFAILVEASDGAAAYRSRKGVTVAVDGNTKDEEDTSYDITFLTEAGLTLRGGRSAALQSGSDVSVSGQRLALSAPSILTDATEILVTGASANAPSAVLRNGSFWCKSISSNDLRSNDIYGKEQGPQDPIPDPQPSESLKKHFNHILPLKTPVEAPTGADEDETELLTNAKRARSNPPALPWGVSSAGPEWAFPPKEEYIWDPREKAKGAVPETLTQQYLRLDAETSDPDRWGGPGYSEWELRSTLDGKRTGKKGGFGFYEMQYQADDSGEDLRTPSTTPPAEINLVTSWRPRPKFAIQFLKRDGDA